MATRSASTCCRPCFCRFLLCAPPPSHIYTLSLHDALPISAATCPPPCSGTTSTSNPYFSNSRRSKNTGWMSRSCRSEEHTSELQSRFDLVCRLLLEKKNMTLAQIAALCATLAFLLRHPAQTTSSYGYSLGFHLLPAVLLSFSLVCSPPLPHLHSFPTRRSSDLRRHLPSTLQRHDLDIQPVFFEQPPFEKYGLDVEVV